MSEERMIILEMLEIGKITAAEAAKLLETLDKTNPDRMREKDVQPKEKGEFFRIHITDTKSGKSRANIRIPLSIIGADEKFGADLTPNIAGVESEMLMKAARTGEVGKIIDVYDDEDNEHIEIYIE